MSELMQLMKNHRTEIETLRNTCSHHKKDIKIRLDHSVVGCGSSYPSVHVACTNCGSKKIIFNLNPTERKKIRKQMERQFPPTVDERLDAIIHYDWELE